MENKIQHIHMLGICGTGMGSLAGLLKEKGYIVTGSDNNVYPPMSTQLERLKIKINIGYGKKNLKPKPDLVIIGNVISRDNEEAEAVLKQNIPYLSMPDALRKLFLKDKKPIVVTGTHGKTTTSNIIAWLLEYANLDPSFLIGGIGLNFGSSYRLAKGEYFVVEGDEYDTAFFDKGPKFLHYDPKYAIITSIEYDHADIYKDLDQVKLSFEKFVETIPEDGICVVCADSNDIPDALKKARCRILSYGFSDRADYVLRCMSSDEPYEAFEMRRGDDKLHFKSPLIGRHNTMNAAAAIIILHEIGLSYDELGEGLTLFEGVKRRQEIRGIVGGVTIIDDFAHHPTAIKETVAAVKKKYPTGKLWAIFEPRSNTTRRKVFEEDLSLSFTGADKVIIASVFHMGDIPRDERLNPKTVTKNLNKRNIEACFIDDTAKIVEFVSKKTAPGDTVLIMSNGGFDNIHEKLITELGRQPAKA